MRALWVIAPLLLVLVGAVFVVLMRSGRRARTRAQRPQVQAVELHASWEQELQKLGFPYERVPAEQAEAAYEAARTKGQSEDFTPLIVTPDSAIPNLSHEQLMTEAQRILAAARPAEEFFARLRAKSFTRDNAWERVRAEAEEFALATPESAPPHVGNRMEILTDMRGTKPPFPRVREAAVVRIPTPRSWEIPAFMGFCGGAAGPAPEEMVAVARSWHERYGADICAMGKPHFIALEFRIGRPPADQPAALTFMREQMEFCAGLMDELLYEPAAFRAEVTALRHRKYVMCCWDL